MRKTLEKIAKQKKVLAKSVLSAAKQLGLTQDQLAIVLNLDSVETLNSLELDPDSSQGELAIILIGLIPWQHVLNFQMKHFDQLPD
jgi:DNA-binding XRE family transcriptional regulator